MSRSPAVRWVIVGGSYQKRASFRFPTFIGKFPTKWPSHDEVGIKLGSSLRNSRGLNRHSLKTIAPSLVSPHMMQLHDSTIATLFRVNSDEPTGEIQQTVMLSRAGVAPE